jgi:hypothetical protein
LLSRGALAEDFTVAAVGAFGEQLTNCRVDGFRLVSPVLAKQSEYKRSFRGLTASSLPDGEYETEVQCKEARIETRVTVSGLDRFAVVAEHRRTMRSDHFIPQLVIRMGGGPLPQGETWWITLRALIRQADLHWKISE